MSEAVIVSAMRTPIGAFQGSLSTLTAPQLGAAVIRAALDNISLSENEIDECIMGNVLTAGVGQAPARQAALLANLPKAVPCLTINKVCGSGLKAVMLASDSIALNHSQAVIAGGQESMSLTPYLLENIRTGYRMGNQTATDSMIKDGLWDPGNNFHMGVAAEICVKEKSFSRHDQDQFAIESYTRAQEAQAKGYFKNEISPVKVKLRKEEKLIDEDEEPGRAMFDKIPQLRPAFDKEGSVTAANASKLNDGAAALIVMNQDKAKALGLKALARIVGHATHAQDPKWFTTAPIEAMKKVLAKTNLTKDDINLWEINEAFSVVTMVAMKEMNIDHKKVNVHGGAVALGHPIGASGARILTTLVHALKTRNEKYGLASICIGGGEAAAVIVENI